MEYAQLTVPDEQTVDGHIARRVSELLEQSSKGDKPFFIAAGFRRPHLLWVAPKKYFDLYLARDMELPIEPLEHLKNIPPPALTRQSPLLYDWE